MYLVAFLDLHIYPFFRKPYLITNRLFPLSIGQEIWNIGSCIDIMYVLIQYLHILQI